MKNGAVSCHTGHFYLEYEPPEGFLEGRIEFSADYWKLGISIYKMLTGHFPFKNEQSIIDDEIPHLQELEISQEAKEIL
jgi:serine/threonine protein kinase